MIVTVWSAPNYCYVEANAACIARIPSHIYRNDEGTLDAEAIEFVKFDSSKNGARIPQTGVAKYFV
jgi:hypothetical protein